MKPTLLIVAILLVLAVFGLQYVKNSNQAGQILEYRWLIMNSQIAQINIHLEAISKVDGTASQDVIDVVNKSLMQSIMYLNLEAVCVSELDAKSRETLENAFIHLSEHFKDSEGDVISLDFSRFDC